jgi:cytochrome c biogenesis protein CcdA
MIEILFAVLAGVLTVGAPCILPILPILLGSTVGQTNKHRPLMIALGFIVTFAAAGLTLSFLASNLGVMPDTLRRTAIILLAIFGIFLIWPTPFEKLQSYLSGLIGRAQQVSRQAGEGNLGGFVLGVMLGLIWTPCAGPVLGSILTLVATSTDLGKAGVLITAYAIGAGIPMLVIAYGSQYVTTRVAAFARYARRLQQIFGFLIIGLAIAMYFQYDLLLQAKLLDLFPGWNFANLKIFK